MSRLDFNKTRSKKWFLFMIVFLSRSSSSLNRSVFNLFLVFYCVINHPQPPFQIQRCQCRQQNLCNRLLLTQAKLYHFLMKDDETLKMGFAIACNDTCFVWFHEGVNGVGVSKNALTIQNIKSIEIGTPKNTLTMQRTHHDSMMTQIT